MDALQRGFTPSALLSNELKLGFVGEAAEAAEEEEGDGGIFPAGGGTWLHGGGGPDLLFLLLSAKVLCLRRLFSSRPKSGGIP